MKFHPPLNPLPLRAGNKTIEIFTKVVAILVALMIISKPIMLSAQMITPEDICRQAKMDAHKDVNGCLWFSVGGAGVIFGWGLNMLMEPSPSDPVMFFAYFLGWPILPMIIAPSPPATRLIGIPPEYIAYYTKCYKDEERNIQSLSAFTGCITTNVVLTVYFVALLLAFIASFD